MPNRIIKESINASEKINSLSDWQFRLWVGLITYVDDYGRGDARPAIIKGAVFPLRERVTNKDIEKGLAELAGTGCVGLYEVDGKPYLYFPNWGTHQSIRNKRSKYPAPDDASAVEINCKQLQADVPVIQSNPNPNPNPNLYAPSDFENLSTPEPAEPQEPPFITLLLVDGTERGITQAQVDEFETCYPAVDVKQELRSMKAWLITNPQKRKTKNGVMRFVNSWLAKEQDRGGKAIPTQKPAQQTSAPIDWATA